MEILQTIKTTNLDIHTCPKCTSTKLTALAPVAKSIFERTMLLSWDILSKSHRDIQTGFTYHFTIFVELPFLSVYEISLGRLHMHSIFLFKIISIKLTITIKKDKLGHNFHYLTLII
jgi:hypothetical protein